METAASHATAAAVTCFGRRRQREHRAGHSRHGALPQDIHEPDQDNLHVRRLLASTRHSNPSAITRAARAGSVKTAQRYIQNFVRWRTNAKMNGAHAGKPPAGSSSDSVQIRSSVVS
jgi:hypothetical protein